MTIWQRFEVTESSAANLPLTREQAAALRAVGKRLIDPKSTASDESDKTAIECSTNDGVTWRVRVVNAVGIIGLPGGVRITVRPKIPASHLLYLLRIGGVVPRTSTLDAAVVSTHDDFQDLIASWFIAALETLVRGGLRQAYVSQYEKLPVVRGRLNVPHTTLHLLRGNLRLACEFEELTEDMALNRILAAAAARIARSRLMPKELRRRARSAGYIFEGLSPMSPSDLRVRPDRIAARYVDAIALARLLISGAGVGLENGDQRGSSFLLPTPLVVEEALRQLVAQALSPKVSVVKGRLTIDDTSMTVNPDLVFGELAIGDVKYKVWDGSWLRSDLYQLIAFAAAYERTVALHVGFGGTMPETPLRVGKTSIWRVTWNDDPGVTPEVAAAAFQAQVLKWWSLVETSRGKEGSGLPGHPTAQSARDVSWHDPADRESLVRTSGGLSTLTLSTNRKKESVGPDGSASSRS